MAKLLMRLSTEIRFPCRSGPSFGYLAGVKDPAGTWWRGKRHIRDRRGYQKSG